MTQTLRNIARILLLAWFVTVSLFIFVPTYQILRDAREADASKCSNGSWKASP